MTALIAAEHLHKQFGKTPVVRDLSLEIARGQVWGLLGPNGAGKTTSMRLLTGFLTADAGQVQIAGHCLQKEPELARRHVGYLPEGAPLYADMTPWMHLQWAGRMHGLSAGTLKQRQEQMIAELHLEDVLHQPVETLSKGFRRRVGLALALLHDPDVLILDEPTDGLDPLQKQEVRQLIQRIAPEKAILISTHILEEVEAMCSHVALIREGRIILRGTPAELLARDPMAHCLLLRISSHSPEKALPLLQAAEAILVAEAVEDHIRVQLREQTGACLAEVLAYIQAHGLALERLAPLPGAMERVFLEQMRTAVVSGTM